MDKFSQTPDAALYYNLKMQEEHTYIYIQSYIWKHAVHLY